jgi:hypothetical protein
MKWFWDFDTQQYRRVSTKEAGTPKLGDYIKVGGDLLPYRPEPKTKAKESPKNKQNGH